MGRLIEQCENRCVHRGQDNICRKCFVICPSTIRVAEDNDNNMPCDGASYYEEVAYGK